nr:hypothetical protein [Tanacetum cinerariifolium]
MIKPYSSYRFIANCFNADNIKMEVKIWPKLPGQKFEDPPFKEEILSFIRELGHTGEIKVLSNVTVNHMHQPWRSFAAIINNCLSGKTTALESLRLSRAQILWGMYHNKNVDYVYFLWEDFVFQVENKNSKKNNDMYYPRFTKVIIDYFMAKDKAIPRRNKMFWHFARDDSMFTTIRVISKHQDTQLYGKKKLHAQGLETLSEIALSEAEQIKLDTKISKIQFHSSHATGSGVDEGTGVLLGVPDIPIYDSDDEKISWKSSDDDDDDDDDSQAQQQSSFVASGFISNMLNTNPDTGIDSILNLNTESTSLVDVPITTNLEIPPSSVTTLPPPHIPLIQPQQQILVPSPAIVPTKTSHVVVTNLFELELKKILIDKMESNNGGTVKIKRRRDDEDDDEEPFAGSNQGSKRKRAGKEPESTSEPKEKTSKSTGTSTEGSKSHQKSTGMSAQAEEPIHTSDHLKEPVPQEFDTGFTEDQLNKTLPAAHGPIQPWISNLARKDDSRDLFNDLKDTPLDFLAFVMNRFKVDTLTLKLLASITFELMKGSCKSLIELEYFLDEPLPLIPNSQGHHVIPLDHFINNDLAYLKGSDSNRTYAISVKKAKVADYGHIKWIEDLILSTMWSPNLLMMSNSKNIIITITKLQIVKWHNYKHLDWIIVRRNDDKLYTFKEECLALNVSLRMSTRSIVIRRRVEDLQLDVKSYQKKLNLTRPNTYRLELKILPTYSAYPNPRGFIYQNKDKKNRLMRINELYKFSDGTFNDVRTTLDDILKRIRMKYLPQTYWRNVDNE